MGGVCEGDGLLVPCVEVVQDPLRVPLHLLLEAAGDGVPERAELGVQCRNLLGLLVGDYAADELFGV